MSEPSVRGKIHLIEPTKTYGQRGFRKRLVVVEQENSRFTNYIPLEFTNEGCDTVDELAEGQEVEIRYRLTGRRWQKDSQSEVKFFLNAEATGFTAISGGQPQQSAEIVDREEDGTTQVEYSEDDVPF